jgi:two-component system, NtrC family, response regulator HydG
MNEKLHILVVDDDKRMTRTLADILTLQGHSVDQAWSGPEALEKARSKYFDCVLTDVRMPGMNGVELHKELRNLYSDLPVILMTAYATDELLRQGMEQGAAGTLEKPLDFNILLEFFHALSSIRTIAIVDDDPAFCQTLADILKMRGYRVTVTTNPLEKVEKMVNHAEFLLLDMKLNGVNCLDLLKQVRKNYPNLPVLLITGYRAEMAAIMQGAFAINARACLYKPLAVPELLKMLADMQLERFRAILHQ